MLGSQCMPMVSGFRPILPINIAPAQKGILGILILFYDLHQYANHLWQESEYQEKAREMGTRVHVCTCMYGGVMLVCLRDTHTLRDVQKP